MAKYAIYLEHGHGTMESPHFDGAIVKMFTGTRKEVEAECERLDIEKHGPKEEWTSWESPRHDFRK